MAFTDNSNVVIKGISAAVPVNKVDIREFYRPEWGDVDAFIASTTIEHLRLSVAGQTASDLCVASAEKLIAELGWDKSEIGAVVFVSQTPDYYFVPATACHIQARLGLSKSCLAFDITLGCSGWVYGLTVLASLLQSGAIRKGLLLAGDTCAKTANQEDPASAPLFGDCGTATALEYEPGKNGIKSALFTDGEGYDAIIIREGGFRKPVTADSFPGKMDEHGMCLAPFSGEMDGLSVFSFAISQAPKSIKQLIEHFSIDKENINILALHQANQLINQKIAKKVKLENARLPQSLRDFGNTSCASIPLSLVTEEASSLRNEVLQILACGYGVGLSWGSVVFTTDHIVVPSLIELDHEL